MLGYRRHRILQKIMKRVVVDETTGCWVWTGPHSGNGRGGGYPRMSLDGKTVAVHIVMYTHFEGYIPFGKQVDHECNRRCCVNPDHLKLTTHLRNQRLRAKRAKMKGVINGLSVESVRKEEVCG